MHETLGVFLQETNELQKQLHTTLAGNDLAQAAAELHALCVTYRTYGFKELGHLCQAAECPAAPSYRLKRMR